MTLAVVPPERLQFWETALVPWLEAVERRSKGRESVVDLLNGIAEQRYQLWLWHRHAELRAIAVTEVLVHAGGAKVCRIRICTGRDRHEWLAEGMEAIADWALRIGCQAVEPVCRRGWERELRRLGYRCTHLVMEKVL